MKWTADENLEAPIVQALRHDGHDVRYASEVSPGAPDDQVLDAAVQDGRVVLTNDKGFGELVFRLHKPARGIVLLRFDEEDTDTKLEALRSFLSRKPVLEGRLTVLTPRGSRSRSLPGL